jgi:hypothetical protein
VLLLLVALLLPVVPGAPPTPVELALAPPLPDVVDDAPPTPVPVVVPALAPPPPVVALPPPPVVALPPPLPVAALVVELVDLPVSLTELPQADRNAIVITPQPSAPSARSE